jgi:hypothetical protein
MSGKAQKRRVREAGREPRATRTDASGAGKGLPTMKVLDKQFHVPRMDERIANAESIVFLMAEVVCKNFDAGYERADRLREAFCELAGCRRSNSRISAIVRRELAKC